MMEKQLVYPLKAVISPKNAGFQLGKSKPGRAGVSPQVTNEPPPAPCFSPGDFAKERGEIFGGLFTSFYPLVNIQKAIENGHL